MKNISVFEAVVDRFEGDYAVLVFTDGQELLWPAGELPDGLSEGSVVYLNLQKDKQATEGNKVKAKDILNEIFNTE